MRPSPLAQVVMLALLIAVVVGAKWLTHFAVVEWIPESAIGYVAVGLLAFCFGWLAGNRSALRRVNAPANHRRQD